jgi:WD40 repeat protein
MGRREDFPRPSGGRKTTTFLRVETLEDRLCLSSNPYLYIAMFGTNSIERYDENTGAPLPANGQSGATFVPSGDNGMHHPLGTIIGYDHNLYVTNLETNEVLRYDALTGTPMPGPRRTGATFIPSNQGLQNPAGILFGPDGFIYVANANISIGDVLRFNPISGLYTDTFLSVPTLGVTSMVFGPDGWLYVGTRFSNSVVRTNGTTVETFIPDGISPLSRTGGCVFGPDGNFYIASQDTNDVLRFNGINGAYEGEFVAESNNGGIDRPTGLLFGPDGNLYVDSANNNVIAEFDGKTGAPLGNFIDDTNGGNPSGPRGLTFWNTNPTTLKYEPGRSDGPSTVDGGLLQALAVDRGTGTAVTTGTVVGQAPAGSASPLAGDSQVTGTAMGQAAATDQLHVLVFAGPDNVASLAGLDSVLNQDLLA